MRRARLHQFVLLSLLCAGRSGWSQAAPAVPHASAGSSVRVVLLSDPHLDPFRDPSKAKELAAADVEQWPAILAKAPAADAVAQYAALQKTCGEKLDDADSALELSAFDAAKQDKPEMVLVGGDMLVHAFGCRYRTLLDASGTDKAGMASFAAKTVEFQMQELRRRFPQTPIHLALGNNDSDCEDYSLDEDSGFLRHIAASVASGWTGVSNADRTAALQDFKRFGSYALPFPSSVARARLIVLDDLYLSSDYRGTCGKQINRASSAALLTWTEKQLTEARRNHEAVWVLAHIPPEVNVYRTYLHPHDICHGQPADSYFATNAFTNLLTQYADTVRVFISGHTHIDEIHLLESDSANGARVALKTIPSVSPISTNPPAYLVAQVDVKTAALQDYEMRVASAASGPDIRWTKAYRFQDAYGEPSFSADAVSHLLQRWHSQPDASAAQIEAYQHHLAHGLRLLALLASWPQQLCAMQHSSAAAFASCACSAQGGLLPPTGAPKPQDAK